MSPMAEKPVICPMLENRAKNILGKPVQRTKKKNILNNRRLYETMLIQRILTTNNIDGSQYNHLIAVRESARNVIHTYMSGHIPNNINKGIINFVYF